MDREVKLKVEHYVTNLLIAHDAAASIPRYISELRDIMADDIDEGLREVIDDYLEACNRGKMVSFWKSGILFCFKPNPLDFEIVDATIGLCPINDCAVWDVKDCFSDSFFRIFKNTGNVEAQDYIYETCMESEENQNAQAFANTLAMLLVDRYGDNAEHMLKEKIVPYMRDRLENQYCDIPD